MRRKRIRGLARVYWFMILFSALCCLADGQETDLAAPGQLAAVNREGKPQGGCPLEHTDVKASISGGVTQVAVTQKFKNPFRDKINAVYSFPLPENAAVYEMEMKIGSRVVRGQIHPREEARKIYDDARRQGHVAALLDQERPNIFTQAVANIEPGARVEITISYLQLLPYQDGSYRFVFPTVVGPRYKDVDHVSPPVTPQGTRAGHDISISVDLDAGMPLRAIESIQHKVNVQRSGDSRAHVELASQATLPNKDFELRFTPAKDEIQEGVLTHKGPDGGYFALILAPPGRVRPDQIVPKEMIFVVDTSGSQMGAPLEKSKDTMEYALKNLNPQDTFNLITFAGHTQIVFPEPVPASVENVQKARNVLQNLQGGGGTEMMAAIRAALGGATDPTHARVVSFMTDGYVGNDFEIVAEIDRHPNARVFPFGIGPSVNRFLIEQMARAGAGEPEYVPLNAASEKVAARYYERVRYPVLTDISVDWGGLAVEEVLPKKLPDLFASKPVVLVGRYSQAGAGEVTLRGKVAGKPWSRKVKVVLPETEAGHGALRQLWARTRIEELMGQDMQGAQSGAGKFKDLITKLAVQYRLMSQYTSFVAVEQKTVTSGGDARTVDVPVELPEGLKYEGFQEAQEERKTMGRLATVGRGYSGTRGGISASADPLSLPVNQPAPPKPVSKLDPALQQLVAAAQGSDFELDGMLVVNGRTRVRIVLLQADPDLEKLVKVVSRQGLELVAEVEVSALEALARRARVKAIRPAT